ncbi:hypothetical protein AAHC03_0634 [Spirometra sp. Aus1]
MKIPPLRSLDDMFGSKFSVPKDEKACDRITSNLLYYQTNYFLITIIFMGITLQLVALCLSTVGTVGLCNSLCRCVPLSLAFYDTRPLMSRLNFFR